LCSYVSAKSGVRCQVCYGRGLRPVGRIQKFFF
jgi:hypothetical protein